MELDVLDIHLPRGSFISDRHVDPLSFGEDVSLDVHGRSVVGRRSSREGKLIVDTCRGSTDTGKQSHQEQAKRHKTGQKGIVEC